MTYDGDGIIIKTVDGGDTWTQISQGTIPGLESVCFVNMNTGYAGGWQNYFIKTTDGGTNWTEIEIDPDIWYIREIEFWDANNGVVAAAGAEVYVTDDGGATWTEATGNTTSFQDVVYVNSTTLFGVGGDEKINKSIDGGLTWTEVYSGTFQSMFLGIDFYGEDYGVVGGEDGKVMVSTNGGTSWTAKQAGGYHLWHGVYCFNDDSTYLAGTPEGVYKTNDGGNNWVSDYSGGNTYAFIK